MISALFEIWECLKLGLTLSMMLHLEPPVLKFLKITTGINVNMNTNYM